MIHTIMTSILWFLTLIMYPKKRFSKGSMNVANSVDGFLMFDYLKSITFFNYYKVRYLIVFKWNINEKRKVILIYFCIEFIEHWYGNFEGRNDGCTKP